MEELLLACWYPFDLRDNKRNVKFWARTADDPYPLVVSWTKKRGDEEVEVRRKLRRVKDDESGSYLFFGWSDVILAACHTCGMFLTNANKALIYERPRYGENGGAIRDLLCQKCFATAQNVTRLVREVDNVEIAEKGELASSHEGFSGY